MIVKADRLSHLDEGCHTTAGRERAAVTQRHNFEAKGFGGMPVFHVCVIGKRRARSRRLRHRGEQVFAPDRPKNSSWHMVHRILTRCMFAPVRGLTPVSLYVTLADRQV
jgi:hypothetical protein